MEQLIHITAMYSNAVLVAILPHVSDFAKTLDLSIVQNVTIEQVVRFGPSPYKGHIAGALWLTNGYWFAFSPHGYVDSFRSPRNWFTAQDDAVDNLTNYMGQTRMSTNEIVAFARNTLIKLGHNPDVTHADSTPELQGPSDLKQGGHIPYCRVAWRFDENSDGYRDVHVDINTQEKIVVGLSLLFAQTNKVGTPLTIDVEPELESEYRKRIQGTMFIRTNALPRLSQTNRPSATKPPSDDD